MKACGILPDGMEVEVHEAVGQAVHKCSERRIPADCKSLLHDPAKEKFVGDRCENQGGDSVKGVENGGMQNKAHVDYAKIVAQAHTPVVRRVAIKDHPEREDAEGAAGPGERAEG